MNGQQKTMQNQVNLVPGMKVKADHNIIAHANDVNDSSDPASNVDDSGGILFIQDDTAKDAEQNGTRTIIDAGQFDGADGSKDAPSNSGDLQVAGTLGSPPAQITDMDSGRDSTQKPAIVIDGVDSTGRGPTSPLNDT